MRITRKLGTLACAAALGAGISAAMAGPASAGGCTHTPIKDFCGVVVNKTPHQILLCWAWDGPGNSCKDNTDGKLGACKDSPVDNEPRCWLPGGGSLGGNGKDVDAFYVPGGHCFDWDVDGIPFPNAGPGWHQFHNGETATVHHILGC